MTAYTPIYEHTRIDQIEVFAVLAFYKDRAETFDGTGFNGEKMRGSFDACDEYAQRNDSPDNPERYEVVGVPEATGTVKLTAYHLAEMQGSEISVADKPETGGYHPALAAEYARLYPKGGTATLPVQALRDLGEWAAALELANAQDGNPSGARSMAKLAEAAHAEARRVAS